MTNAVQIVDFDGEGGADGAAGSGQFRHLQLDRRLNSGGSGKKFQFWFDNVVCNTFRTSFDCAETIHHLSLRVENFLQTGGGDT